MISKLSSRQRVLDALELRIPDRVPHVEFEVELSEFQTGRISDTSINDVSPGPEMAEMLSLDAVGVGYWAPVHVEFEQTDNNIRWFTRPLLRTEADLRDIRLPELDAGFFDNAYKLLEANDGSRATFAGLKLGPSLVYLSMGMENFCCALHDNPSLVNKAFDLYAEWTVELIDKLNGMDIDMLFAADDLAFKNGPIMSPHMFRDLILPRMKEVADHIEKPWVFHTDGDISLIMDDLLTLGMRGIHPVEPECMDIGDMKREYGERVCLVGNVSVNTLAAGTVNDVEKEVKEVISKAAYDGGFILSSGNSIPAYCKTENVVAMCRAVERYGKYPLK